MCLSWCLRIVWLVSGWIVHVSELECGCLDFGCDCVGMEHEAIGEGEIPYGSDFSSKVCRIWSWCWLSRGRTCISLILLLEGGGFLLDKVEGFCGEDVEGGLGWRYVRVFLWEVVEMFCCFLSYVISCFIANDVGVCRDFDGGWFCGEGCRPWLPECMR